MKKHVEKSLTLKISTFITSPEISSGNPIERKLSDITNCEPYDSIKDYIIKEIVVDVGSLTSICGFYVQFFMDKKLKMTDFLEQCASGHYFSDMYKNGFFLFDPLFKTGEKIATKIEFTMDIKLLKF